VLAWSPLALTRCWLLLCALSACSLPTFSLASSAPAASRAGLASELVTRLLAPERAVAGERCCRRGAVTSAAVAAERRCTAAVPTRTADAGPHSRLAPGHADTAGHPVELRFAGPPDTASLLLAPGFAVTLSQIPGLAGTAPTHSFTHLALGHLEQL
jgi:hypothetical protein